MKEYQFKTNIMCGSCIEKVTPSLNDTVGADNWKVDTANPAKILTVKTADKGESEVIDAVKKAGYKAEPIA